MLKRRGVGSMPGRLLYGQRRKVSVNPVSWRKDHASTAQKALSRTLAIGWTVLPTRPHQLSRGAQPDTGTVWTQRDEVGDVDSLQTEPAVTLHVIDPDMVPDSDRTSINGRKGSSSPRRANAVRNRDLPRREPVSECQGATFNHFVFVLKEEAHGSNNS